MREVIYKELTSLESRKKKILLREIFERDGVIARTERRSFYFIKNIGQLGDENGLKEWMAAHDDGQAINKRHFHILREHNDSLGEDKIICKIGGVFYAIVDNRIYTIAFMNCFKASFVKASLAK